MKIALFLFFLSTFNCFSQDNTLKIPLESSGEIPVFLKNHKNSFLLPEQKKWIRIPKNVKKDFLLNYVYSSNMIIFGDETSKYCTELVKSIVPFNSTVYLVRSNINSTFSNPEGDIFITTGMFSNLTCEAELLFILLREYEIIQTEKQPFIKINNNQEFNFENIIQLISNYSLNDDIEIDKHTISLITSKTTIPSSILSFYYLNTLNYKAPFKEEKIDWNYFTNNNVYIPITEFIKTQNKDIKLYKSIDSYPEIQQRITTHNLDIYNTPTSKIEYSFDPSRFIYSIKKTKIDIIYYENIVGNFYFALYEIYTLEKEGYTNPTLDYLKAISWLNIVKQKNGEIELKNYHPYFFSDNEGAIFCRFIRSQKNDVLTAYALRTIYDLKNKYENSNSFKLLYNEIIKTSAKNPLFELEKFKKLKYTESVTLQNKEIDSLKKFNISIDKNKQNKLSKTIDSLNFHLYFLSDIITDNNFKSLFQSYKPDTISSIEKNKFISVNYHFNINLNKSVKKTEKKFNDSTLNSICIELSKVSNNTLSNSLIKNYSATEYNQKFAQNATIFQQFHYSNYKKLHTPVLIDNLKSEILNQNENIGIILYEHKYKPRIRDFDFIGVFVITLPYVIPEFFYRGHYSNFSSFYFNSKTGLLTSNSYRNINDPFNVPLFKNQLLESLK